MDIVTTAQDTLTGILWMGVWIVGAALVLVGAWSLLTRGRGL